MLKAIRRRIRKKHGASANADAAAAEVPHDVRPPRTVVIDDGDSLSDDSGPNLSETQPSWHLSEEEKQAFRENTARIITRTLSAQTSSSLSSPASAGSAATSGRMSSGRGSSSRSKLAYSARVVATPLESPISMAVSTSPAFSRSSTSTGTTSSGSRAQRSVASASSSASVSSSYSQTYPRAQRPGARLSSIMRVHGYAFDGESDESMGTAVRLRAHSQPIDPNLQHVHVDCV